MEKERQSKEQLLRRWAEVVLDIWEERMVSLNIMDSMALARSFAFHIQSSSGGDIERIEFAYNYYGVMVDMGVGRGVRLEDRGLVDTRRKPKPWYTQSFFKEIKKLQAFMVEHLAHEGAVTVVGAFN